ncbi:MAG: hypothetical protein OEZ20_09660 [candidate division WOR-3 bacterium]|nr:hypothetical protein [candidate division WOR-3 bacterium]
MTFKRPNLPSVDKSEILISKSETNSKYSQKINETIRFHPPKAD